MIGFIGVGNMGGTLAKVATADAILVSSKTPEHAQRFAEENGCTAVSNEELARRADMIFLGVKPHQMAGVLQEIAPYLKKDCVLVSMAAGLTTVQLESYVDAPVLRIMPNTPSLISQGCIPYCKGKNASDADCERLCEILKNAGNLLPLEEALFDAASAVAGCGPAFVYIFIEALADAAVACGLPRKTALELAAKMVTGSAQMVLQTQKHPAELKDAVCSPGGSTIAGVCALDENGFRNAAQKAVLAAYQRNQALGK